MLPTSGKTEFELSVYKPFLFVELTGILLRIKTWGNQNFLT